MSFYTIRIDVLDIPMVQLDELMQATGLSEEEINTMIKAGLLPKPEEIHVTVWKKYDVQRYMALPPNFIRLCLKGAEMERSTVAPRKHGDQDV